MTQTPVLSKPHSLLHQSIWRFVFDCLIDRKFACKCYGFTTPESLTVHLFDQRLSRGDETVVFKKVVQFGRSTLSHSRLCDSTYTNGMHCLHGVTVSALTSLGLKAPDAETIHRALSDLARQDGADAPQVRARFIRTICICKSSNLCVIQVWSSITRTVLSVEHPFAVHALLFKAVYSHWPHDKRVRCFIRAAYIATNM